MFDQPVPEKGDWWSYLIDGSASDLPDNFSPITEPAPTYHAITRRIIADTTTKVRRSPLDPRKMGENQKWLTAVTRWRRSLQTLLELGSDYRVTDSFREYLEGMRRCMPPGFLPHPDVRFVTCRRPSTCLFCFARACGNCYADLVRCLARRPDPDHPVRLVIRSTGQLRWGTENLDPKQVLMSVFAAGGVVCRLPIKKLSGGVIIGLTDKNVPRSVPLTQQNALAVIGDAITRNLAYPIYWCKIRRIYEVAADASERKADGNRTARAFESYGLCRKSIAGHGSRIRLRYHEVGR